MTLSRRRITPYAAGLIAALALAACSGGGPAPSATPASPTSTAVPSAPAPTTSKPIATIDPVLARIPAAARPETMEGAAEFAAFYLRQLNEASKAGDPAGLEGLAKPSCTMCKTFYDSVSALRAEGHRHAGDTLKVTSYETLSFVDERRTALVKVELFAVPIVDSTGRTADTTEADSGAFVATLAFEGRWYISRLQVAK